ncbi:HEAT repeat domain-containing protein [Saccharopolyspora tripterygii]
MRTVFIHGEQERFDEASAELINRFTRRHPELGSAELLELLLDDKVLADGMLAHWCEDDLQRVLTEVVPRRAVLTDDWSAAPELLHRWLDFLADERLLTSNDAVSALHEAVDVATPAYLRAMADPSEWGSEKFWTITMRELGVDDSDDAAVEAFHDAVDAGELDVDQDTADEIASREAAEPTPEPKVWLSPVELAEDEPHREIAASAPIIDRIRSVVEHAGEGDVEKLAATLGSDAGTAGLLLEWAQRAGLLRTHGDQLAPTLIAAPLLAQPELVWTKLWQSFVLLDDAFRDGLDAIAGDEDDDEDKLPDLVQSVLSVLYGAGEPIPLEIVAFTAADVLDADDQNPVTELVTRIVEQWESMNALRTRPATEQESAELPFTTYVELLPAGVWAARESLRAFGFHVPTMESLRLAPAELAVLLFAASPPPAQQALAASWIEDRGAQQAAEELTALLELVDDPVVRLPALALLEQTGEEGVTAARAVVDDAVCGPAVRMWLESATGEQVSREGDQLLVGVDAMAVVLETDVGLFIGDFAAQPEDEQLRMVGDLASSEHAYANALLSAIAENHEVEEVSAAARNALDA